MNPLTDKCLHVVLVSLIQLATIDFFPLALPARKHPASHSHLNNNYCATGMTHLQSVSSSIHIPLSSLQTVFPVPQMLVV